MCHLRFWLLLSDGTSDAIRKSQTLKRFLLQLRKGFAPLPSIYKLPVPKGTGLFSVVSSVDSLAFDELRQDLITSNQKLQLAIEKGKQNSIKLIARKPNHD